MFNFSPAFTLPDLEVDRVIFGISNFKTSWVFNKNKIYDSRNSQRDQFLAYAYLDYFPRRFKKINPVSYTSW